MSETNNNISIWKEYRKQKFEGGHIDEQKNLIESKPAQAEKQIATEFDLNSSEWFLNRELTWLEFNRRVLHEGQDSRNPLLERVFFLSVVGSNLDEFFMKRIGGLKQLVGAGVKKKTVDGMLPQEQIDASYVIAQEILEEQRVVLEEVRKLLKNEGISFCSYEELTASQKKEMDLYFNKEIYPLLTPQGIDPAHPFPFISNMSLNLLVATSEGENGTVFLNRVKIPNGVGVPRFLRVSRKHLSSSAW